MHPRRPVVEMMDEATAEIMRQKTPAERLKIAFDMWDFAFDMIHANLRREHPDWSAEEVQRETARRIGSGGNS
jgi:hypothetical protein